MTKKYVLFTEKRILQNREVKTVAPKPPYKMNQMLII